MPGIEIAKSGLISRTLRNVATGGQARKLNLNYTLSESTDNIIGRFLNFASRFVGFLSGVVHSLRISVSSIYGWVVSTIQQLSTFDWNATDQELLESERQRNVAVASAWGSFAGTTAGQLAPVAIGAGLCYFIPVIGGAVSRAVIADALPEALEEIGDSLRAALGATASAMTNAVVLRGYINLRKAIKGLPEDTLKAILGERLAHAIKHVWGAESAPRFTFADQTEQRIENIGNPYLRAFTEEAVDEFFDSFIESGFVVTRSIDQAIAEHRAAIQQEKGTTRTVLVQPDRRAPGEAFAYSGAESDVKTMIQQSINTARLVQNRDVGQIVGMPAEDWFRAKPQRRKLVVVFKSVERPPYYRAAGAIKTATYSIPEPRQTLSWERIKRACRAYNWGKFRATANLTNGRQMACYGSTPAEAEDKLKDLLELSDCEISTLSITEEKDRNPKLRKDSTRVYPAFATMLIRRPSVDRTGRTDIDGNTWEENHIRFDLWTDDEPPEFDQVNFAGGASNADS